MFVKLGKREDPLSAIVTKKKSKTNFLKGWGIRQHEWKAKKFLEPQASLQVSSFTSVYFTLFMLFI